MLRRNALIFHNAALGDFVVTWPLAVACGRLFPQSRIFYVTAAGKGKLAEHVLGVESIDIESGFASLWAEGGAESIPGGARKLIEGAHAIVSFVADAQSNWAANVRAIAPQAMLACVATKPAAATADPARPTHVARSIAEQIAPANAALAAGVTQMVDSLERRGLGRRTGGGGVLIHPGSGAERKNWPRERFVELARRLAERGRTVSVVVGEVEIERWGPAGVETFAASAKVVRPASLVELATLCASADVVVANDSGPAHLSAALGTPTVSLFGPTSDARRWRPLGPAVRLIEAASLEQISVDQVLAAVGAPQAQPGA